MNWRKVGFLAAMVALLIIAIVSIGNPAAQNNNKLLVIAPDGLGWERAEPWMSQGLLPGLSQLRDNGFYGHMGPVCRTVTIPNWTVCFTGQTPDFTGVVDNLTWRALPAGATFLVKLKAQGVNVHLFTSKRYLSDRPGGNPWANDITAYADSFLWSEPTFAGDGYFETVTMATLQALDAVMASPSPAFVFCHLDPDYYGHRNGAESERYFQEVQKFDVFLQKVLMTYPDLPILVVSDHGFNPVTKAVSWPKGHLSAPYNLMAATSSVGLDPRWQAGGATMLDLFPTICRFFRVPFNGQREKRYGKPLN